jgi:phosphopantothenoylcysteine synthetase/decarboxylase
MLKKQTQFKPKQTQFSAPQNVNLGNLRKSGNKTAKNSPDFSSPKPPIASPNYTSPSEKWGIQRYLLLPEHPPHGKRAILLLDRDLYICSLSRMRILITAGGTREYIDPVRFISNASTGRMGYALATAAIKAGHKVTLITAPTALCPPRGAKVVNVETSAEMFNAVKKGFIRCDCLIMAAAVADYTPAKKSKAKIKKGTGPVTLKLKPTPDILKWAGRNKKKQIVAGFALEDKSIHKNAVRKLKEKNLDMIIANTPTAIGSEEAAVQIKTPGCKWITLAKASKTVIARKVIRLIESGCK